MGEVENKEYKEGGKLIIEWAKANDVKLVNGLNEGVMTSMFRDVIHLNENGQRNLANSLERLFTINNDDK